LIWPVAGRSRNWTAAKISETPKVIRNPRRLGPCNPPTLDETNRCTERYPGADRQPNGRVEHDQHLARNCPRNRADRSDRHIDLTDDQDRHQAKRKNSADDALDTEV
jgi:hypothetical protein